MGKDFQPVCKFGYLSSDIQFVVGNVTATAGKTSRNTSPTQDKERKSAQEIDQLLQEYGQIRDEFSSASHVFSATDRARAQEMSGTACDDEIEREAFASMNRKKFDERIQKQVQERAAEERRLKEQNERTVGLRD
jgi:hypothetical protein